MEEIKLRRLPPRAVLSFDSQEVEVEKIGRGRYTTAWRGVANPDAVYLQVREGENSKELLSRLEHHKHIPALTRLGTTGNYDLYQSPYYSKLTPKSGEAWQHYRALEKHIAQAHEEWSRNYHADEQSRARITNERFQTLAEEDETLPESLREAITSMVTWAASYGEYLVEITAKNLAVDTDGSLILLDPLFDLAEVREATRKAQQRRF